MDDGCGCGCLIGAMLIFTIVIVSLGFLLVYPVVVIGWIVIIVAVLGAFGAAVGA